jgi:hypothetical protein
MRKWKPRDRLKELGKEAIAKRGLAPNACGVEGCEAGDATVVKLLPLDPIDHGTTIIQLCPNHLVWAKHRNELAREVKAELVALRKEIGQRRIDEIAELAAPQDGDLPEEILQGEYETLEESGWAP